MTTQEKLQAIRAKVVEANPEIIQEGGHSYGLTDNCPRCNEVVSLSPCLRPIRLADVLLALNAIHGGWDYFVSIDGRIATNCHSSLDLTRIEATDYRWNLRKDSLDDQSPETIDFLHNILV